MYVCVGLQIFYLFWVVFFFSLLFFLPGIFWTQMCSFVPSRRTRCSFYRIQVRAIKNFLRSCGLVLFIYIYLWSKTNFYFTAFCLFSRVVFQSVKLCCISKVIFLLYNSKISHKNFLCNVILVSFLSFSCFYLFPFFFQKQTTCIFFI